MRQVISIFALVTGIVLGSSVQWSVGDDQNKTKQPNNSMTFWVGSSSTNHMLEDVTVLVARKDGRLEAVGRTDASGRFTVPKASLREDGSTVVLFCKERFFCGAFRLDDPKFLEADYRLIHLAPFSIP